MKKFFSITLTLIIISLIMPPIVTSSEYEEEYGEYYKYKREFYGVIEKLPEKGLQGIWIINGREVLVTEKTFIKEEYGTVAVGAYVEVKGGYEDNVFKAWKIEVKRGRK